MLEKSDSLDSQLGLEAAAGVPLALHCNGVSPTARVAPGSWGPQALLWSTVLPLCWSLYVCVLALFVLVEG